MSGGAPPPPSQALRDAVADLQPVETRSPVRDWLLCAIISIAAAAAIAVLIGFRKDLEDMPRLWIAAFAIWWAVGFNAVLRLTYVPRRGQVTPRARVAGWVGLAFGAVAAGIGIGFATSAPTSVIVPSGVGSFFAHGWPCYVIGTAAATVPVGLAFWYLRGTTPMYTRWLATGIGAAGGALGGLVLHAHCPIVNPTHLGFVHGIVPLLVAGIAALAAGLLLRPRSS